MNSPDKGYHVVKEALRHVIREELDQAVGMLFTPAPYKPACADVKTERTLLSGIFAGWANADDIRGLSADDFYHPLAGGVFTLAANPLLGGSTFSLDVMAHSLSRMGAGREHRVRQWIEDIVLRCPVILAPSLREQANRISELARWRRFFQAMTELQDRACLSVSMGRQPASREELREVFSLLSVPASAKGDQR